MKLLLDEMLSPRIAAELHARGHDVVAIKERPDLESMSDPGIIAAAQRERRAIVTNNLRDFRPLYLERVIPGGGGHAGMIFIPTSLRLTKNATGHLVSELEAKLVEHPGDDGLADGETWLA